MADGIERASIDTGGGASMGGDVATGGDLVGRDRRQEQRVVVNLDRRVAARTITRPRKVVDEMSPMLTEISHKLQEFEIKLDRVLTTLGDDVLHGPGLVSKFNELRADVNEMRSIVENMRYGLWLFGSVAIVAFVGMCVMILRSV